MSEENQVGAEQGDVSEVEGTMDRRAAAKAIAKYAAYTAPAMAVLLDSNDAEAARRRRRRRGGGRGGRRGGRRWPKAS